MAWHCGMCCVHTGFPKLPARLRVYRIWPLFSTFTVDFISILILRAVNLGGREEGRESRREEEKEGGRKGGKEEGGRGLFPLQFRPSQPKGHPGMTTWGSTFPVSFHSDF